MASGYALGRFVGPGIARLLSHVERSVVCAAPKSCQKSPFVVHSWRCKHTGTRNTILCSRKIHGSISNTQAGSCFTPKRFQTSKPIAAYTERCNKNLNLGDFNSLKICSRSFNSSSYAQRKVLSSASAMNPPSVKQIEHFLNSKNIPYEHGHTSIVVACQHCEKEKKDGKSLYVNKTTGSHYCKTCGRSGTWRQFKAMFSDKESNKSTSGSLLQPVYSEGIAMTTNSDSDKKAKEIWDASLPLREAEESLRKKIEESFYIEKLNKDTLTKYKVHVTQHKFSEPSGEFSNHQCLVFPWFDSNNSTVCGVKLVKIEQDDSGLVALQPRLGTLGLFGWNTVTPEAKEVVLTVNEFDAIAVHQATSRPAISLPLGAYSLPPEVLPQLEQFERIILWFGEDVRARQAANQFSKKLSIQRCHIVRPAGDKPPSGPLDALNKGFDLSELIDSSKPISHEKIATFQELRADVYSEMVNAEQVAGVKWSRFPKLNALLKGHRRGELTIFTGPTGAGKTTLLSEMSVDLCQQGVNTLWGSFEIRNVRLAKMMMNQFSGMDLQKNVQQFNYWADKFEMLPMYFMCFYGSQSINTVIETMAHAVYVFDIDHVIIDNLQFMTSSLRAEDRFSIQNQAISCLRDFASSKNVHVTLVIHPRKENDDVELQTASIFGTAKASQEADNVLILQDKKGRGEKYLQVTKNRFDGSVGRVPLEFVKSSLSMCGFGKKDNNNNKNIQNTFKVSRKVSDIDMINIPSSAPIQKARARPYSPGYSKAGGSVTGGARISNSETLPHRVPDQTLSHSIISKTHSPGTQTSDSKMDEGATESNTKTSPPEFSTPKKGARLSFSSKDVESVRTFQENLSESIRSKGVGQKSPVLTPSKVTGDEKKLNAKKLYSKTIASLVAKHVTKHRIQKKPLRTDAVRPAVKTSK